MKIKNSTVFLLPPPRCRVLPAIRRLICCKQNFPTTMNIILQFTGLS